MPTKIVLQCGRCNTKFAHLFLFIRKGVQLAYIHEMTFYCGKCNKYIKDRYLGTKEFNDMVIKKVLSE